MKTIGHYIFWLKRDFARWIVRNSKLSIFLAKNCLKTFLSLFYFDWTGSTINWKEPEDFNQWLLKTSLKNSRSENKEIIAKCADKFAVRDYVSSKGFSDTLVELIGVYNNVDDIDFESLPDSFVMKMNNASGRNLICPKKSQINWDVTKETFRKWLNDRTFGLSSGEWQYSLIEPKIVIEQYLESANEASLIDYKFHCIYGEVYSCFVGYNRNPENPHSDVCFDNYDLEWNRTESIKDEYHPNRRLIERPSCYHRMVQMAKDLCKDFDYCRFDVYEVNGKLYFGEMTFTPHGCVLERCNQSFLKEALNYANNASKNG